MLTTNLLQNYVKKIILREGMETTQSALSLGYVAFDVYITKNGRHACILFDPKKIKIDEDILTDWYPGIVGVIAYRLAATNCRPAEYEISSSAAKIGWGPTLYDYVLSKGWTMSDRKATSQAAQKIWKYYFENRDDAEIEKTPCKYLPQWGEYIDYAYRLTSPATGWDELISSGEKLASEWEKQIGYDPVPKITDAAFKYFSYRYKHG
jgi:uncharacterized protein YheU (UPF0270 family)